MRRETYRSWEKLTSGQHALLSRSQAFALGLTRGQVNALVARGSWVRVLPSVYRIAASPKTWRQPLMAACLWAKERAVISGRSAAAVWEFEGYWRTRVELCSCLHLTAPSGLVVHQVSRLDAIDTTTRRGIRVTSAARTILDLTPLVSQSTLERTLDEALRKGHVTVESVLRCIQRNGRRGRAGIAHLEALLAERKGQRATDSPLESDIAGLLREFGLPSPVKRYRVIEHDRFIAEVDLAWPEQKLAVQAHGSSYHRQLRTWENDQRVENELQLQGWFVAKMTRRMLDEDREQCAALVARILRERSRSRGRLRAGSVLEARP